MNKILISLLLLINVSFQIDAQYSTLNAHSHNDYENDPPFWLACNNHFGSIEADIWAIDGELFVAHYRNEIKPERTLDSLYIVPIVNLFLMNGGKAWKDYPGTFQLLVDIKTPVEPTLSLLVQKLERYPGIFNPKENKNAVRIVISGNRPEPSGFRNYPGFIFFDGLTDQKYDKKQLKRVPLFSANFRSYSSWNGTGDIKEAEKIRIQYLVDSIHSIRKKIRFWNSPDDANSWNTFMEMEIDYINTDHIVKLAGFFK